MSDPYQRRISPSSHPNRNPSRHKRRSPCSDMFTCIFGCGLNRKRGQRDHATQLSVLQHQRNSPSFVPHGTASAAPTGLRVPRRNLTLAATRSRSASSQRRGLAPAGPARPQSLVSIGPWVHEGRLDIDEQGQHSDVNVKVKNFKAYHMYDKQKMVAVKIFNKAAGERETKRMRSLNRSSTGRRTHGPKFAPLAISREISVMAALQHPHIIQLEEIWYSANEIIAVMELADCNLFSFIMQGAPGHKEKRYFFEICSALEYMHSMSLCHRDIKPENILICKDTIKIADFGFAAMHQKVAGVESDCGSLDYMAPELLGRVSSYDGTKVDMWSLGVVYFVMLTATKPFEASNDASIRKRIQSGQYILPSFLQIRPEARLISRLLKLDPSERPSATAVLDEDMFARMNHGHRRKVKINQITTSKVEAIDLDVVDQVRSLWRKRSPNSIEEDLNANGPNMEKFVYDSISKFWDRQNLRMMTDPWHAEGNHKNSKYQLMVPQSRQPPPNVEAGPSGSQPLRASFDPRGRPMVRSKL